MKYNGEVIAENIEKRRCDSGDRKNHQLIIHLNKKGSGDEKKDARSSQLTFQPSLLHYAVFCMAKYKFREEFSLTATVKLTVNHNPA